jgi:hypothetical protein
MEYSHLKNHWIHKYRLRKQKGEFTKGIQRQTIHQINQTLKCDDCSSTINHIKYRQEKI